MRSTSEGIVNAMRLHAWREVEDGKRREDQRETGRWQVADHMAADHEHDEGQVASPDPADPGLRDVGRPSDEGEPQNKYEPLRPAGRQANHEEQQ